jgi:hypothetical protein
MGNAGVLFGRTYSSLAALMMNASYCRISSGDAAPSQLNHSRPAKTSLCHPGGVRKMLYQLALSCVAGIRAGPQFRDPVTSASSAPRYRKDLIAIYHPWFTFSSNTMRENAHGETDPR